MHIAKQKECYKPKLMPKILVSKLDKGRAAFDEACKGLIAQMRRRANHVLCGQAKEDAIKFMDDSWDYWVKTHPDFTRKDFADSKWGELAEINWIDPTNKALAMHRAYEALRKEEKEMMASWRS
jgi:hypothetical protein